MRGITIRGLVKEYPRTTDLLRLFRRPFGKDSVKALRGIDLDLAPGRIYGLIGPNGAGKTTLLKIIGGLVLPTQGRVLVDGADIVESRIGRDSIGFVVANERSFFWRLSLLENLRFFAVLQKVPKADRTRRILECLETVGLESVADHSYHGLSTGMRQRLAIARGLLSEPRILLLDEATRSLDPDAATSVRSLVARLVEADSERLVIYSSHNLAEVEDLCDHLLVLQKGRIVAEESLGENPSTGTRVYLITLREALPSALAEMDEVEHVDQDRRELIVRVGHPEGLDGVIDRLRRASVGIVGLRPLQTSLEERYFGQPGRSG